MSYYEVPRISTSTCELGGGVAQLNQPQPDFQTRRGKSYCKFNKKKTLKKEESAKFWWRLQLHLFRSTTLNNLFLQVEMFIVHCPHYKEFEKFSL